MRLSDRRDWYSSRYLVGECRAKARQILDIFPIKCARPRATDWLLLAHCPRRTQLTLSPFQGAFREICDLEHLFLRQAQTETSNSSPFDIVRDPSVWHAARQRAKCTCGAILPCNGSSNSDDSERRKATVTTARAAARAAATASNATTASSKQQRTRVASNRRVQIGAQGSGFRVQSHHGPETCPNVCFSKLLNVIIYAKSNKCTSRFRIVNMIAEYT